MKLVILLSLVLFNANAFAEKKKFAGTKKEAKMVTAETTKATAPSANPAVPCDSKEDLLKKLEEKKKQQAESATPKAFSLQGGDTGCKFK